VIVLRPLNITAMTVLRASRIRLPCSGASSDRRRSAGRPESARAKDAGQAGRVRRGRLDGRAFHDHDDVLELAEVLGVFLVERGIPLVKREEMKLGRFERERMRRVAHAHGGRGEGDRHGKRGARAAEAHEGLQCSAGHRQRSQIRSPLRRSDAQRTALPDGEAAGVENSSWCNFSFATSVSYDSSRMTLLNCAR
jgi:hypothetical protein